MAYVGTLATPHGGTRIHGGPASGIRRAWSLFRATLTQQIAENRRDLKVDQALSDLDRRQLKDIGVCRDAC